MARSTDTEGTTAAEKQPQTVVYLGNRKTVTVENGERVAHAGKRCTTVRFPEDATLMSALNDIAGPSGIWAHMSDAPAPAWVAAEGPMAEALTQLIAAQYPGIEIRKPEPEADSDQEG